MGQDRESQSRFDRRSFLRVVGGAGVVGSTSMLAGCMGGGGDEEPTGPSGGGTDTDTKTEQTGKVQTGGTLTAALQSDPWTLHPHKYQDTSSAQLAENYGNTLVDVDSKGEIYPDLAKEVPKPTNDGKTYVFKLREGVQFHGEYGELTAEDVVANYRYILDLEYGSPARADYKGILVGADTSPKESVKATGKYEVTFNLTKPYAPFLYKLADPRMTVIPPKTIERYGKNLGNPDIGIWATGPFKFDEALADDHYTFKRNSKYFKKDEKGNQLPYLDKITFTIVPEASIRSTQLKTGDIDVAEIVPAREVKSLKQAQNVAVNSRPGTSQINLYINQTTYDPFTDVMMRKALGYASNKKIIQQTKFKGLAAIGWSIFPPWHWAYDESAVTKYEYNPQKAKSLIEKAGASGLQFNCSPTNQPIFVDTATILQQSYSRAGLNMEISPKEKSAAWEPTIGAWDPKAFPPSGKIGPPPSYHSHVEDITFGFDADGYAYLGFHTGSWLNVSYYSNDQVDTWLDKARTVTDRAKRKEYYTKIQSKVTEDIPQVFQVWWNVNQGYRKRIQNFDTYPTFVLVLEEVWVNQG